MEIRFLVMENRSKRMVTLVLARHWLTLGDHGYTASAVCMVPTGPVMSLKFIC